MNKYNLSILVKRERFAKLLLIETITICFVSIALFMGKSPTSFGNEYDLVFTINSKTNAFSFLVLLITPIISSLPNGDINNIEEGIKNNIICKTGKVKYYFSKLSFIFVLGFVNVLYVYLLIYFMQLMAVDVSSTLYTTDGALQFNFAFFDIEKMHFSNTFINNNTMFICVQFVLLGLFGGSCAMLSYSISQLVNYKAITYIGSFLVSFVISVILQLVSIYGNTVSFYNCFRLLIMDDGIINSDFWIIIICLTWIILLAIISIVIQLFAMNRE